MITLTISKNPDSSAWLRLSGCVWQAFSIPASGRFTISLVNYETGETKAVTSASSATGGVSEARTALLGQAKADGLDLTGLLVVEQ